MENEIRLTSEIAFPTLPPSCLQPSIRTVQVHSLPPYFDTLHQQKIWVTLPQLSMAKQSPKLIAINSWRVMFTYDSVLYKHKPAFSAVWLVLLSCNASHLSKQKTLTSDNLHGSSLLLRLTIPSSLRALILHSVPGKVLLRTTTSV